METFMLMFSPSHKIVVFYYALEYSDEKHYKSIPKTRKAKKEFSRSLVLLRMANHIPHSLSELRQHLCISTLYSKMDNSCTKPKCQDLLSTYSFLKNNQLSGRHTGRKMVEQIIGLDSNLHIFIQYCEQQPNNKSNSIAITYLEQEEESIAQSLQGEALKKLMKLVKRLVVHIQRFLMDCFSGLPLPH